MIEEGAIGQFEEKIADYDIVFKIHIAGINSKLAEGMWSMHVYID